MRRSDLAGWLAVAVVGLSPVAHADTAAVPSAASIAQKGDNHGTPPCSSCHGAAGEGNPSAGFPRLAGLPAAYLLAQLNALADGTRQNPVMAALARAMGVAERTELAKYYAALPLHLVKPTPPTAPLDDRLALHGRWSEEIPACIQCHGASGGGVGSRFPALTGQSSLYIASQLRAWKEGTRHGDPLGLMQAIASRLSEQDINSVSDYFAAGDIGKPADKPVGPAPPAAGSPVATGSAASAPPPPPAGGATVGAGNPASHAPSAFTPSNRPIPNDDFGKVIELGRNVFENPAKYATAYVGNDLRCSSCHLDEGRRVGSAPMWAAYVSYPAYRAKNHHVNTFEERLQGCFRYSMNGKSPPLGDPVLVALESYAYWMAQGAPVDPNIAGRGYIKPAKAASPPDYQRGAGVYSKNCALCHGDNGDGQHANDGSPAFPALWGSDSFNWGAGMGSVTNAAAFIKSNMPLGRGNTLSDQDAWDVALFMNSHERPQDPRYTGSVADTRTQFHDEPDWMYGKSVNGHVLGSDSVPPGPRARK